jgi:hypothetical protein
VTRPLIAHVNAPDSDMGGRFDPVTSLAEGAGRAS